MRQELPSLEQPRQSGRHPSPLPHPQSLLLLEQWARSPELLMRQEALSCQQLMLARLARPRRCRATNHKP